MPAAAFEGDEISTRAGVSSSGTFCLLAHDLLHVHLKLLEALILLLPEGTAATGIERHVVDDATRQVEVLAVLVVTAPHTVMNMEPHGESRLRNG